MHLERNVSLAPYTTLRIGGPARFYTRVTTYAELIEALGFARAEGLPSFLLGGGSNLLVADEGYPGLVIHLGLAGDTVVDGELHEVAAGTEWDSFVRGACELGYSGVECLAGIPGLAGGTPVQNVGAYGQEVAQTIARVTALDLETLATVSFANSECRFAYRQSLFNSTHRNRYIVTAVRFRLSPEGRPNLTYADLKQHFGDARPAPLEVYEAVRGIRRSKGMLLVEDDPDSRSAGSFFKNPVIPVGQLEGIAKAAGVASVPNWPSGVENAKLPAAWLLDQAGFHKGFALGEVGISSRHTLALINRTGRATCVDILRLRDAIVAEVQGRFGIRLEQEPVYLA
ncbi:UDP-N-acetylmuramate dehydrogenase [Granulicella sp. WH15]|uniref:UDP-N-acetylmuramate dehydrogenase n=1 Tax=Granulicella sp. WH15 TaxID=2602070 RepID=UPI00136681BB|nr:UDP-N-acetylmuramate dehydrogenase [Granulicella sp. WH15]QHN04012.1 UDP-N-acetylmuramate dehydrogenase [Granulicella sp. WH15]